MPRVIEESQVEKAVCREARSRVLLKGAALTRRSKGAAEQAYHFRAIRSRTGRTEGRHNSSSRQTRLPRRTASPAVPPHSTPPETTGEPVLGKSR